MNIDGRLKFSEQISVKLYYQYALSFDERNILWKEFLTLPNHSAAITFNYYLAPTFMLWSKIKYMSEADWTNMSYADNQLITHYSNLLPERFMIDA